MILHGNREYCIFASTRQSDIEKLPNPFCDGIKASQLWIDEIKAGMTITRSVVMVLPVVADQDAYLVFRLGYYHTWQISHWLRLGENDDNCTQE